MSIKVSPSILGCNLAELGNEIKRAESAGADMLHFDIMDGVFVNNISYGQPVLEAVAKLTTLPLDVHLMITEPIRYIRSFAECGANIITFHAEACSDVKKTIAMCRECGVRVGIAIKPNTGADDALKYLDDVDMVLVMTVEPGFGGQGFIRSTLEKVKTIHEQIRLKGLDTDLQVDGGINEQTVTEAVSAGANVIVSGTYLFRHEDFSEAVKQIKAL